tara:strand:+ start:215 stop:3361 length:3147 start_codon:yes stop_codon:yes gene_type:complete
MSTCSEIMCKFKLHDKPSFKNWLLKNHPDKGGDVNPTVFSELLKCYKENSFCLDKTPKKTINKTKKKSKLRVSKNNRAKIFTCMRKTANFSKINNYHKFDKSDFNQKKFNEDLKEASPKITQLLNNINKLDELDQKNHGKKFKHFIFSDVKEGGYGAKILASAFMSNNYNNVIKAKKIPKQKQMKLYIDYSSSTKNFGLLCSNSIYGTTFNEKIKKELLQLFNERPGNIQGQKLRFIIFDSGFKEGIDLFDVKYVHIFEPSMTIADLKQTVGRATRTCGQKGLDFQPGVGWPLYVYNYFITIPDITKNTMYASKFLTNYIKDTDDDDEDILIFKNIDKMNDATMYYSEFDAAMNNLSKQLFELAPSLSVDYELTKNLHNVDDLNHQLMEKDFYLMGGAKNASNLSKYYSIDNINCQGKCGKRSTLDIPVHLDFMKQVYKKYNHPSSNIPKNKSIQRDFFCKFMRDNQKFCDELNYEWSLRYSLVPQIIENKKTQSDIKNNLEKLELEMTTEDTKIPKYDIVQYIGKKETNKVNNTSIVKIYPNVPKTKLNFLKLRDFIKTNYNTKEFKWDKLVIENKCLSNPQSTQSNNSIQLNPTQNFITKFFCPESPYKGILLWHSVGTGKTCTGVATATTSFERQGYNILWITRTTLKTDVWKNIFDQICHTIILDEVKKGLLIPKDITARKKLLSKSWLEPMSYKQFSNLLAGKNKIYDILVERNGKTDILKKTLIIIDEAHKLYGGDLKPAERPNVEIMERLIMNSYQKSNQNSCKLLLMTATPFTNSPLELFSLINLFLSNQSEKITTNKELFKKQYMNENNLLTQNSIKNLANKMAGYISYLNREKDPTQFAQPVMINIPIFMTHVSNKKLRDIIYLNEKIENLNEDLTTIIAKTREKLKNLKEEDKYKKTIFKYYSGKGQTYCNNKFKTNKSSIPQCIKDFNEEIKIFAIDIKSIEEEIQKIKHELDYLTDNQKQNKKNKKQQKESLKDLKDKVKKIKQSIIQEYILYKKCAFLKYKNSNSNITKKQVTKSLSLNNKQNIQSITKKYKSY